MRYIGPYGNHVGVTCELDTAWDVEIFGCLVTFPVLVRIPMAFYRGSFDCRSHKA